VRRRGWIGWSVAAVVGVAVFVVSITGEVHQPWEHYTEPLGAVVFGQGLGQLIRGWWRTRHDRTSSLADGDT
jgi:hypothetical protein